MKCVMSQTGRNVAKLISRRTAKIAVDKRDVAMAVYGSVRIDLFLRLNVLRACRLGLWGGLTGVGCKRNHGRVVERIEEPVVVSRVMGLIW